MELDGKEQLLGYEKAPITNLEPEMKSVNGSEPDSALKTFANLTTIVFMTILTLLAILLIGHLASWLFNGTSQKNSSK